jgi:putative ABC transport system ATP-binding protein
MKPYNDIMISCRRLSKTYNTRTSTEVRAVADMDLTVRKGEIVLIIGPNGSGKTTLLSMIGCMIPPTSGSLCILGQSPSSLSQHRLTLFRMSHMGFVFQTFRLLDALTVFENIELPLCLSGVRKSESRARTKMTLESLHLLHRACFYPNVLSGGEKQRVAIARALARDPSIILADEPTGNLDSLSGKAVIELLCTAARKRGKSVVIVSHDARIEPHADRILRMEDGRIQQEAVR